MKALCPSCGGKGCEQCDGGHVAVSMATGSLYTRACQNADCGFENGGRICKDGATPVEPLLPCVMCKSPNVAWKYVCEV